jgi:hypothetical protein
MLRGCAPLSTHLLRPCSGLGVISSTQSDQQLWWIITVQAALVATRRDDLEHGTNAAYVQGCVCSECREHKRIRIARRRDS